MTTEGEQAGARVPVVLSQVMNELLSGFSRAEWETLKSMLQRMLGNAETQRERDVHEPAEPAPRSRPPRARREAARKEAR